MAQGYDGEVIIDTELKTDGIARGSKELEQSLKRMASGLKGLSDQQKSSLQSLLASFNLANRAYSEQAKAVDALRKKQEQLNNMPGTNKAMDSIAAQMDKLEQKYNELIAKQKQLRSDLISPDIAKVSSPERQQEMLNRSPAYTELQNQINQTTAAMDRLNAEYQRQESLYKADLEQKKAANLQDLARAQDQLAKRTRTVDDAYDRATQTIKEYSEAVKKAANENKKATAGMNGIKKGLDKTGKSANYAGMSMRNMLMQSLLFSVVFRVFSAIMASMGEALNALAMQSSSTNAALSSLQSSLQYLSSSIVAAFSPILEFVAPILSTLIDLLAQAVAWIGQFFAALTGKGTYTKAVKVQKDYAAGLADTGKAAKGAGKDAKAAAKDAELATLSFDELNQLDTGKNSGGGGGGGGGAGGGGGGGGTGTEYQYEEVAVDSALTNALNKLKDLFMEVAELFGKGFDVGFVDTRALDVIKDSLISIRDSLVDIFTDPAVQNAAAEFARNFIYQLGVIVGAMTSIGASIAANLLGGIAKYLEANTELIKSYIINMFDISSDIMTIAGNFAWALATIFSSLSSDSGQQITANLIAIFANAFMGVTQLALSVGRDILNMLTQPFVDNAELLKTTLEAFFAPISEILGTLATFITTTFQQIQAAYDAHMDPFIQSFTNGISSVQKKFLEVFNQNILPIIQNLATKFDELVSGHIQPLVQAFLDLAGTILDCITQIWESILQPFLEWFVATFGEGIAEAIGYLLEVFMNFLSVVSDIITSVLKILNGVLEFLLGAFTDDWRKSWNGIEKILDGVWNLMKTLVRAAIEIIRTVIEQTINQILQIWTTVWNAVKALADTIWTGIKDFIGQKVEEVKTAISTALDNIKTTWDTIWNGVKTSTENIFSGIWNFIRNTINNILSGVESMANGVVDGINKMINALNNLSFDIPDWVPGIGGNSFGLNIPTIGHVSLPRLASGTVVPPQAGEFAAILGDNNREAEVVSPLSTMRQALTEALAEAGITGTQNIVLRFEGNLAQLARILKPAIDSENKRVGVKLVTGGI